VPRPRIERTYADDGAESKQWSQALVRLLSDGLFHRLKKEGLLRKNEARQTKISRLLQETSRLNLDDDRMDQGLDSSPDLSVNGADSEEEAPP